MTIYCVSLTDTNQPVEDGVPDTTVTVYSTLRKAQRAVQRRARKEARLNDDDLDYPTYAPAAYLGDNGFIVTIEKVRVL